TLEAILLLALYPFHGVYCLIALHDFYVYGECLGPFQDTDTSFVFCYPTQKILRRKTTTTSDSVALGGNSEDAASGGGVGGGSEGRGGFQESKSAAGIHLPASVVAQVTPSTSVLESLSSSLLTTAIFVLVG